MGEIAAAARMSVGQIYRYFPNKEAIIHAIVERIVAQRVLKMVATVGATDMATTLAEPLAAGLSDVQRDDQILMLEVIAEATRNPAVAKIVQQASRRLHDQAVPILMKEYPSLSRAEVSARVELLAVLFEGTLFRRIAGHRKDTVPIALYRDVIERVLPTTR
ncbi:MAG: TetR family transcriptional regulator [Gammaproteobacteria bacterium]|nr:TetR family transcriptional regulator [Gammaproteobacteria bacterium]